VCADAGAIFVGFRQTVGADGDEPAIGNLQLAMKLNQELCLTPVFRTEASPAEH
jgi:hypothetical protein